MHFSDRRTALKDCGSTLLTDDDERGETLGRREPLLHKGPVADLRRGQSPKGRLVLSCSCAAYARRVVAKGPRDVSDSRDRRCGTGGNGHHRGGENHHADERDTHDERAARLASSWRRQCHPPSGSHTARSATADSRSCIWRQAHPSLAREALMALLTAASRHDDDGYGIL